MGGGGMFARFAGEHFARSLGRQTNIIRGRESDAANSLVIARPHRRPLSLVACRLSSPSLTQRASTSCAVLFDVQYLARSWASSSGGGGRSNLGFVRAFYGRQRLTAPRFTGPRARFCRGYRHCFARHSCCAAVGQSELCWCQPEFSALPGGARAAFNLLRARSAGLPLLAQWRQHTPWPPPSAHTVLARRRLLRNVFRLGRGAEIVTKAGTVRGRRPAAEEGAQSRRVNGGVGAPPHGSELSGGGARIRPLARTLTMRPASEQPDNSLVVLSLFARPCSARSPLAGPALGPLAHVSAGGTHTNAHAAGWSATKRTNGASAC